MIHKAMEEYYVFVSSEDSLEHFELIKFKGFCLVVFRSFEGHVRHFFVQDADRLENRLVRVSDVRIISHEIPAYVHPYGGCFERRYERNVK
jgi:hypothetical protein